MLHHYDMGNIIKDVELMASTVKTNLKKPLDKLKFRDSIKGTKTLTVSTDAKIWKMVIKYQILDINRSIEICKDINEKLQKLQKDILRTEDDLNNVLYKLKSSILASLEEHKISIDKLKLDIEGSHCGIWDAIFTLGISCAI